MGKFWEIARFQNLDIIQEFIKINVNKPTGRVATFPSAFFAGRRSGGLLFILLQNYMIQQLQKLPTGPPPIYLGTSSVDAWYLFSGYGGKLPPIFGVPPNPVGTHAHELQMVMSTLYPKIDNSYGLPVTQTISHLLYCVLCNIWSGPGADEANPKAGIPFPIPVLPDTYGTAASMLLANCSTVNGIPYIDFVVGGARQDSGTIPDFCKILDAFGFFSKPRAIMASEISNSKDIIEAASFKMIINGTEKFPINNCGTGGVYGDNPTANSSAPDSEPYIGAATKPVCVMFMGTDTIGYPVKLGDTKSDFDDIHKYIADSGANTGKIAIDRTAPLAEQQAAVMRARQFKVNGLTPLIDSGVLIPETNKLDMNTVCAKYVSRGLNFIWDGTNLRLNGVPL